MLKEDNIDFYPNISTSWYIGVLGTRAHKPILHPPSPNIAGAFWLIAVAGDVRSLTPRKRTRPSRLAGPTLHPQGQEPAGRLFIDGVMELTRRNPLYTRVDLSQDVAWQPRARPTSHGALNASQWEDLTVHICGCVCGGWGCVCVCGWGVTKQRTFAGCTSLSSAECVIQNQANDYLPSPRALTQFWFMIQMNIDFPGATPLHTHIHTHLLSSLPFLLLTKEWMMYVHWFPINYFYSHFI